MKILVLGLVLFLGIHLFALIPAVRQAGLRALGNSLKIYRLVFSVIALAGLLLVIYGFQHATPILLRPGAPWAQKALPVVMPFAFLFFISARLPTHWSRPLRHPQLLGLFLWSFFHYFANGHLRDAWLFGSLMIFAIVAVIGSEWRGYNPQWRQPTVKADAMAIIIALVAFAFFASSHRWLFGVPAMLHGGT